MSQTGRHTNSEVGRALEEWTGHLQRRADAAEAERDARLATHEDRDLASRLVAQANADGRLSMTDHEERIDQALVARTVGELDDALDGLGGFVRPVRSPRWRKIFFWVVTFPLIPILFFATGLVVFGDDLSARAWGVVISVSLWPGVWALRRWAYPRT